MRYYLIFFQDILLYDVYFLYIGLGSYCLPEFPFIEFYNEKILPLLKLTVSNNQLPINIIIRRAVWLVNCWSHLFGKEDVIGLIQYLYIILKTNPSIPVYFINIKQLQLETINSITIFLESEGHDRSIYHSMDYTLFTSLIELLNNFTSSYARDIVMKFIKCILKNSNDIFYDMTVSLINVIPSKINVFVKEETIIGDFTEFLDIINLLINIIKIRSLTNDHINAITNNIIPLIINCFEIINSDKTFILVDTLDLFINTV